jgi:hypothetical protein
MVRAGERATPVIDGATPIRDAEGRILRVILVLRAAPVPSEPPLKPSPSRR